MNPNEQKREINDLRGSIEETRQRLVEDVEQVSERLSPEHMKEVAREKAKETIMEIKDNAMEAVQQTADSVARVASEAPRRFGRAVRDNPIPTAMICVGAGWLLYRTFAGGKTSDSRRMYSQYDRDEYGGPVERHGVGEKVREVASGARERASRVLHTAGDRASSALHTATDRSKQLARRGQMASQRAWHTSRDAYETHPVMFGVGAIALGAGLAFVLPGTDSESRVLARPARRLVERAKEVATEAKEKAMHALEGGEPNSST